MIAFYVYERAMSLDLPTLNHARSESIFGKLASSLGNA